MSVLFKVMQSRFGFTNGNCFEACVSTLTGIPLEAWPSDLMSNPSSNWLKSTNEFLAHYGFFYLEIEAVSFFADRHAAGLHVIVTGKSPRAICDKQLHAVVGRFGADGLLVLVHDPHPDGTFIVGEFQYLGFLIPRIPVRVTEGGGN